MKLEKILAKLGTIEKNSFIRNITNIINEQPKNEKQINKILDEVDGAIKNADDESVSKIFNLIAYEYSSLLKQEFLDTANQFDVLIDILIRDGNCIMSREWMYDLYRKDANKLKKNISSFKNLIDIESDDLRVRDYKVYRACLETAFTNDLKNNLESKITSDEQSILVRLSDELDLSQEEIKLINYQILPLKKKDIDDLIEYLKKAGIILYSKKNKVIYVPDEMVTLLRSIRGRTVADKYVRRILKSLRDPQLNLIAKKHNIKRSLTSEEKIKLIINEGIGVYGIFANGIHKEGISISEKKKFFNEFIDKKLSIKEPIRGTTLKQKVGNLIAFYNKREQDDRVAISLDGYNTLLTDLGEILSKCNNIIKNEYELQAENVLSSRLLLDLNIMPKDVLYVLPDELIRKFCAAKSISIRGDEFDNILDAYKDTKNLLLENYEQIANRNLNQLKENGIRIKEADLGIKFEELTKTIFTDLGFNVNETLRKSINTKKDKIDILISLTNNNVLLIECKSIKERGYNKYSSISRQLKSYISSIHKQGYTVIKSFIVAPEFSDDFVSECSVEMDFSVALIKAKSLLHIHNEFKNLKLKTFPHQLIMNDLVIDDERIVKAMKRK